MDNRALLFVNLYQVQLMQYVGLSRGMQERDYVINQLARNLYWTKVTEYKCQLSGVLSMLIILQLLNQVEQDLRARGLVEQVPLRGAAAKAAPEYLKGDNTSLPRRLPLQMIARAPSPPERNAR